MPNAKSVRFSIGTKKKTPSLKKKKTPSLKKKKTPSQKKKTPSHKKGKTVKCSAATKRSRSRSRTRHTFRERKMIEYPDYKGTSELVGKDYRDMVIHGADMKDMNLSDSKLQGAKFVECIFINTNFDNARVDSHTEFIKCKFINCKTANIKYVDGADKAKFDIVFNAGTETEA